jgi:phage protein D
MKRKKTRAERLQWAEDHPTVKLLRELVAKGRADLEAKRAGRPVPPR